MNNSPRIPILPGLMLAARGPAPTRAGHRAWTSRPPMGWNSWNSFGATLDETEAKAQADYDSLFAPHASRGVDFAKVDDRSRFHRDETQHTFVVNPGAFDILVGTVSDDIRETAQIETVR